MAGRFFAAAQGGRGGGNNAFGPQSQIHFSAENAREILKLSRRPVCIFSFLGSPTDPSLFFCSKTAKGGVRGGRENIFHAGGAKSALPICHRFVLELGCKCACGMLRFFALRALKYGLFPHFHFRGFSFS